MAAGDLITTERAVLNDTLSKLNSSKPTELAALISAASKAITRACMHNFGVNTYTEFLDGNGWPNQLLQLSECPMVSLDRLAVCPVPALRVSNSGNQRATIATTDTGVNLVTVLAGAPTTTALSYSTYPTLLQLATAISNAGHGWSASPADGYGQFASVDLRPLQGAVTATKGCQLEIYVEEIYGGAHNQGFADFAQSGWRLEKDTAQLWGYFPEGRQNIRVDYTAGEAVPEDIQQACVRLVSLMYEDELQNSTVKRTTLGPFTTEYRDRSGVSMVRDPSVWEMIAPLRDLSKLI